MHGVVAEPRSLSIGRYRTSVMIITRTVAAKASATSSHTAIGRPATDRASQPFASPVGRFGAGERGAEAVRWGRLPSMRAPDAAVGDGRDETALPAVAGNRPVDRAELDGGGVSREPA